MVFKNPTDPTSSFFRKYTQLARVALINTANEEGVSVEHKRFKFNIP